MKEKFKRPSRESSPNNALTDFKAKLDSLNIGANRQPEESKVSSPKPSQTSGHSLNIKNDFNYSKMISNKM